MSQERLQEQANRVMERANRITRLIEERFMTPRAAATVVDAAMFGIGCLEGTVRKATQERLDKQDGIEQTSPMTLTTRAVLARWGGNRTRAIQYCYEMIDNYPQLRREYQTIVDELTEETDAEHVRTIQTDAC